MVLVLISVAAHGLEVAPPAPGQAGCRNDIVVTGATPGASVRLAVGAVAGITSVPSCPGIDVDIDAPRVTPAVTADALGTAVFSKDLRASSAGRMVYFQAIELAVCTVSPRIVWDFPPPVGASSPPGPVTCPYAVDTAAVTQCQAGGHVALHAGVGYPGVQAALDVAPVGGTVVVCPGIAPGSWTVTDRTVRAADPTPGATTSPNRHSVTRGTLIGLTKATADVVDHGTFECMHVELGNERVFVGDRQSASIAVRHSTISTILTDTLVGAHDVLIEDSAIVSNRSTDNGGLLDAPEGTVTLRRSVMSSNRIPDIYIIDPHLVYALHITIEDSWIEGNVNSDDTDGALFDTRSFQPLANVLVSNSTFVDNSSNSNPLLLRGNHVEIRDSTFRGNAGVGNYAGGLVEWRDDAVIERSVFVDNTAETVFDNGDPLVADRIVVNQNHCQLAALVNRSGGLAQFTCTCCDFGVGTNDNQPADGWDGTPIDELPFDFTL